MPFQLTASDQTRAVIDDVQINHSGTYMCEVTVTPTFFALMQFANMTVIGKSHTVKPQNSKYACIRMKAVLVLPIVKFLCH